MPLWFFFYYRDGDGWEKLHIPFVFSWIGLLIGLASLGGLGYIEYLGTGKGRFPIPLVLFYGLELLSAYWIMYKQKWAFPPRISMAFLLTFFSSYFWEFPLHILDLISFGLTSRFIIQSIRLLPIAFFWMNYEIRDRKALINSMLMAHMVTLGIFLLEWDTYLGPFYIGLLRRFPIPAPFQFYNPNPIIWTFVIRIIDFIILLRIFFSGRILNLRGDVNDPLLEDGH